MMSLLPHDIMKRLSSLRQLPLLVIAISSMACKEPDRMPDITPDVPVESPIMNPVNDTTTSHMRIRVGTSMFRVTLLNNPTVIAFKARLPLTLSMRDLNGNEKFVDLANSLPTNPTNPGTIQVGDLTLYGSNTLVLFYETFQTSYSYTKLGRIDNPMGLAAALGTGGVTVVFEVE